MLFWIAQMVKFRIRDRVKMRAAITQREVIDKYGMPTDVLEAAYVTYFEQLNITLRPISNFSLHPTKDLEQLDLLILTGGGSVPAAYYGDGKAVEEQKNRDRTEKILLEHCFSRGIPVLAICRGMQYINGLLGGKVRYLHNARTIRKDHPVCLCRENRTIQVNHYHDDGILHNDLAPGLTVEAVDETCGSVEAFSVKEKRLLAVQWHPERPFEVAEHRLDTDLMIKEFLFCRKG